MNINLSDLWVILILATIVVAPISSRYVLKSVSNRYNDKAYFERPHLLAVVPPLIALAIWLNFSKYAILFFENPSGPHVVFYIGSWLLIFYLAHALIYGHFNKAKVGFAKQYLMGALVGLANVVLFVLIVFGLFLLLSLYSHS